MRVLVRLGSACCGQAVAVYALQSLSAQAWPGRPRYHCAPAVPTAHRCPPAMLTVHRCPPAMLTVHRCPPALSMPTLAYAFNVIPSATPKPYTLPLRLVALLLRCS
jgi:hypothetical protein